MKKWILITLPILIFLFGALVYFYVHFNKVSYKNFTDLITELEAKSESFENLANDTKRFNFSKGSCNIFISIVGDIKLIKADLVIFFKLPPFRNESDTAKEGKEQEACLNFGLQTFTILFEDKKTKQEFFKISKKLLANFQIGRTLKSRFYLEELTISTENGELKISLN